MMEDVNKTVPNSSIGVDGEQSICINKESIPNHEEQNNQQAINSPINSTGLDTISMDELYDTIYPPKIPIVDGLLYSGTYLFVGAPKVGKSFFMAQLGYHVSKGIPLWNYPVQQGEVLYLALEDDFGRLQKRLSRMFGTESTANFHFAIQSKNLNEGLEGQLIDFIEAHKNTRLIIIDTLKKVREACGDQVSYGNDYDIVTSLKKISDKYGICLLVVHHTRKLESADSFDKISGTNGLLGAADGAFVMCKKKRTENKAVLDVAGRDQQDQAMELNFNREQCVWELTKVETELWKEPSDPIIEAVAQFITEVEQTWEGTASQLLGQLNGIDLQPNVFTRKLNISVEKLFFENRIRYESKRSHNGRIIKLSLNIEE